MANFYNDNKDLKFHLTHPLMEKIVRLKERNFSEKERFDFAPMDFEDAIDSFDKVLEVVGEISGEIVAPNAESVDAEGPRVVDGRVIYARGTKENIDALNKAGLMGMSLPRRFGGLNF
ncbi:MAG: acyl-CoA dehydrogenase, partial [Prolixibacteraceae bacterium]